MLAALSLIGKLTNMIKTEIPYKIVPKYEEASFCVLDTRKRKRIKITIDVVVLDTDFEDEFVETIIDAAKTFDQYGKVLEEILVTIE